MKRLWDWVDRKFSLDPLDVPLIKFSAGRLWTMRNAYEGTLVMGSIGSGKTSGAGQTLAVAMLRSGFSGIVLCDKKEEPGLWKRYCEMSGRAHDLVFFKADNHRFNPLEHETDIFNKVALLQSLMDIESRNRRMEDPYWQNESRKLLENLLRLAHVLGHPSDLALLSSLMKAAPSDSGQAVSAAWLQESICGRAMEKANSSDNLYERRAAEFFTKEFSGGNDKSRSIVKSMVSTIMETLLREGIAQHFTGRSTITPERLISERRILVVDLPLEDFKERGVFANQIWKYCFQRAVRSRTDHSPTFLWADEAQNFLDSEDHDFQATCRSRCCATVYLTQNHPGLVHRLGEQGTGMLVGNLTTKIFHRNECDKTRDWASKLIGCRWREKQSETKAPDQMGRVTSQTTHLEREPIFQPEYFEALKSGGATNGCIVEAVVVYPRGPFNESRARRERFHQRMPGASRTAQVLGASDQDAPKSPQGHEPEEIS